MTVSSAAATVSAGGTVFSTTVQQGGTGTVSSGGLASGYQVQGQTHISSGGITSDAMISSGGLELVGPAASPNARRC